MNHKLNKILPLLAISLTSFISTASAVDDMQVRNLENRVNALEQRRGANGMVNPPARPVVKDGYDVWLQAEALFMHVTEDGVGFAIKQEGSDSFNGRVKNIEYDWNAGFRVGVGYNLPHDGWDMLLNYSWFRSSEDNDSNASSPESLFQTWTNAAGNDTIAAAQVAHAKGRASLKFTWLDLELGREFFVSKWLTLRPFVGARAVWPQRNLKVTYKGGDLGVGNLLNIVKLKEKFNDRFRGAGLRAGIDSQWGLGCGWSLFGDFALSLLYGKHRLHETQDLITLAGTETRFAHAHDAWTTVRTMTDLGLGVRWDHLFYDDAYRIRLQLGWEQHSLIGFDRDLNFVDDVVQGKYTFNQGDLALSGVAFQARFDF